MQFYCSSRTDILSLQVIHDHVIVYGNDSTSDVE